MILCGSPLCFFSQRKFHSKVLVQPAADLRQIVERLICTTTTSTSGAQRAKQKLIQTKFFFSCYLTLTDLFWPWAVRLRVKFDPGRTKMAQIDPGGGEFDPGIPLTFALRVKIYLDRYEKKTLMCYLQLISYNCFQTSWNFDF